LFLAIYYYFLLLYAQFDLLYRYRLGYEQK
jgi:hypothetical protein